MMLGFVSAPRNTPDVVAAKPKHPLLTVELKLPYHRKYLGPAHKTTVVEPDMARKIGQALLDAGAINIIDNGPASAQDAKDGYHTFTVRVTAVNPLSSLSKAEL